ncbi:MAG: hypothetical protein US50_C0030G0007 [Candidatus Nomurabacteria bacterium GW2011_GWB1_37_5]|uniref:Uncharacterized protein n=1 Tax=Candidatus Nomurabacteria bacterium GW2011_GWB1_37_5 TaxID=1618742 RepID=A0A0G0H8T8_9BACT|nr:MAG: hypothetical protein US50_C0030G0007 [Candidatus Nomurabacteria bacterium GW2011_GWB1_37_5]
MHLDNITKKALRQNRRAKAYAPLKLIFIQIKFS